MGALYERYLAEQQQSTPLYQRYLASKPKPGILETAKHVLSGVGSAIEQQAGKAASVFLSPVEGEVVTLNPKTGLPTHPGLAPGTVISKANTPNAITLDDLKRNAIETSALALSGPTEGLAADALTGSAARALLARAAAGGAGDIGAEALARAGTRRFLAHIAASSGVNAGVGAVLDPEHPLHAVKVGAGIGAVLPVVGGATSAIIKRGAGALGRATDVTGGLDEAVSAGAREGIGDAAPQFDPQAIAAADARRALLHAPPSPTSQLLRDAQQALSEGQARGLERGKTGTPMVIEPKTPPGGPPPAAPSLRSAIQQFDEEQANARTQGAPTTYQALVDAFGRGEQVPDRTVDRLVPTETPHDAPEVKRIRAEMEALGPTSDIPDEAPATATQFPDVSTRGELRQAAADRLYGSGAANKNREAWIVTGPPAAGKSALFAVPIARETGSLKIDNDDVKDMLDESLGGRHNGRTAGESADIASRTFGRALAAGDNIVLPIVGRHQAGVESVFQTLQDQGYRVHLVHNDVPAPVSAGRAMGRYARTGKFVDPRYILQQVGDLPGKTFQALKNHPAVSTFRSFSNDVPQRTAARLLEEGGPGLTGADALPAGSLRGSGRPLDEGTGSGGGAGGSGIAGEGNRPENAAPAQAGQVAPSAPGSATGRPRLTGLDGQSSEAFFQDREVPVRYRVVEADAITPSNNAETFERNPDYPQVIQGRAYHGEVGRSAREQVIAGTQSLNAKKLLNPGSNVGGPPIITPDGLAIAGNQRTMMLQRAAGMSGPQYAAYRQLLEERAARFGVDPAEIARMQHPVLVREITDPSIDVADHEQLRQLNAASDAPTLKSKDPLSDANTRAAQLRAHPEALASIADHLDPDETIRQHLDRRGLEFFRSLQEAGVVTPQEMAKFYDRASGKVTEEGKTLAERTLQLAAVPNPDVIQAAPDAVLRRLEHSIPAVVAAGTRPEWSLEKPLTQALELITAAKRSGMSVREFLTQGDAFNRTWSDEGAALARTIEDTKRSAVLADKFRRYADAAAASEQMGQSESLFGDQPERAPDAFARLFESAAPAPSGGAGVKMLTPIATSGTGALYGATQGNTPEERRANALKYGLAGLALGAGVPYLLRSAPRAAEVAAPGLRLTADPALVSAAVRGQPTREQLADLIEQVRANPRAKFRYVARDAGGNVVSTGTSLADLFADLPHTSGNRVGAVGELPGAGARSPLRPNVPYRPKEGVTPPPVANAEAAPPPTDIDPDDYLNFSTVLLDPGGEQRLRAQVAHVVQTQGLSPKQRVSWEATKQLAGTLGLSPEDLVKKGQLGRLSGAEMLAIRNIVVDNVSKLEEIGRHLETEAGLPAAERDLMERLSGALDRQNDVLLSRFVQARTQAGRDLNNLKILATGTLDPAVWLGRAKQVAGPAGYTEVVRARVMQLINAGDRGGLAQYVATLRVPTPWEKVVTVWKAGLLTGPPTHLANAMGNTTMAALETAKDVPAAALDAMLSAVTGQRTKNLAIGATIRASAAGAKQGFEDAKAIMSGRAPASGLNRYDLTREIDFKNAFLDRYTKTVFRALTAADAIFKRAALARSLAEQARVVAKSGGFAGKAFDTEVERLIANPTDEMALRALSDAEIATFQNKGALGSGGQALRRAIPGSDLILPFTMTPANVATRVVEYSPLGPLMRVNDMVKLFNKAIPSEAKFDIQKRIVETLGRSAIGSTPILAGYLLAKAGRMTGGYPTSQTTRGEWALEGKQENSVKWGGTWHSLERVSPLGNLTVLGASLYDAFSDTQASLAQQLGSSAGALAKTVTEQSFLTGVSGLIDAVKDPERSAGRMVKSTVASVVPAIVSRLARAVDPTVRERETIGDELKYRIPGLSQTLPARVDQFGRTLTGTGGAAAVFDPSNTRADRGDADPVVAEVERVGAELPALTRKKNEEPTAFYKRRKVYGIITRRVVGAVVESPEYRQARQLAEVLVARDPRFRGTDPRTLAAELQKGILEDAVKQLRRALTVNGVGQ